MSPFYNTVQLLHIAKFLPPEDIVSLCRADIRIHKFIVANQLLWEYKAEENFPHHFANCLDKNVNWRQMFIRWYRCDYTVINKEGWTFLDLDFRRKFSLVKSNSSGKILFSPADYNPKSTLTDLRCINPFKWMIIKKQHNLINPLYENVFDKFKKKYPDSLYNPNVKFKGLTLKEWMICCHKSTEMLEVSPWNDYNTKTILPLINFAAEFGHAHAVVFLIGSLKTVLLEDGYKATIKTAMVHAARNGWIDTMEQLFNMDKDLKYFGQFSDDYPLDQAALKGHYDVVRWLVDKKIYGLDPLVLAVINEHVDIICFLMKKRNEIGIDEQLLNAAYYELACSRNLELIKLFLDAGVEVDVNDETGETALFLVCSRNYEPLVLDAVRLLLSKGAKLGLSEALRESIRHGNTKVIELLKKNGAVLKTQDKLLLAICNNNTAEFEEILGKEEVNLEDPVIIFRSREMRTLLTQAVSFKCEDIVRLLLERKVDTSYLTDRDKLPLFEQILKKLYSAIESDNTELFGKIFTREAQNKDQFFKTILPIYSSGLLKLAIFNKRANIVQILESRGIKISTSNDWDSDIATQDKQLLSKKRPRSEESDSEEDSFEWSESN